ncbi:MAG: tRNA pseudouridine(55) synthase TruB [Bacteroidota bacterium]
MDDFSPPYDFRAGAILLVDKPLTWTSFDVVNKIRYTLKHKLKVKKIKVGHAGTLDPLATGLLIVCTGKFTKKIDSIQVQTKQYTGRLLLGKTTPSFDAEQAPDASYPIDHIDKALLEKNRIKFIGNIEQYPPHFSAIKVDGVPLYKSARRGVLKEVKPRPVQITQFDLTEVKMPEVDFFVECSKGTYIRSLANDFGKSLGSGAYLTQLCRTAIGDYQLTDAWQLEDLVAHINSDMYTPVDE